MSGKNNPNFRNAGQKVCVGCGSKFQSYDKQQRYCSLDCYSNSEEKIINAVMANDDKRKQSGHCKECGAEIYHQRVYCDEHNPNIKRKIGICTNCGMETETGNNKKYCRNCRDKNGYSSKGSIPKKYKSFCSVCGKGIKKWDRKYCDDCWRYYMTSRHGNKWRKDHNQDLIVEALEKAGCSVLDLSMVGGGCPDIMVGKNKKNYFMEIKNPETGGKLNDLQKKFIDEWDAPIFVVRTPEEALRAVGAIAAEDEDYGGHA